MENIFIQKRELIDKLEGLSIEFQIREMLEQISYFNVEFNEFVDLRKDFAKKFMIFSNTLHIAHVILKNVIEKYNQL